MDERKCKTCSAVKPIEDFQLVENRWNSRRHECKVCQSERKKSWYNQNIERVRKNQADKYAERKTVRTPEVNRKMAEYQRSYREKLKQIVYQAYGNKCACCGEAEPKFLSIDHVNNDGGLSRRAGFDNNTTVLMGRIKSAGFPDDFQLLCMNCNHGKSRNGGICPHKEGSTTRA